MSTNSREPDTDRSVYQAVLDVVRDVSAQLGSIREQVRLDLADYLARYREDAYRATMALATRVTRIELQMEDDAKARAAHEKQEVIERTDRQRHLDRLLFALFVLLLILAAGVIAIAWRLWR